MFHLTITQEEAMQIEVMIMDDDEQAALIFIREKILPEIKKQQQSQLRSHLDGGKGSIL
jgi:hypothetical protein